MSSREQHLVALIDQLIDQLTDQLLRDAKVLREEPHYHVPSTEFYEERTKRYLEDIQRLKEEAGS